MSVPELKITGNVKQNKVDVEGSLQGNSYLQWKIPGLHWRWAATAPISKASWG
jgi:translocation and assembly module TamB